MTKCSAPGCAADAVANVSNSCGPDGTPAPVYFEHTVEAIRQNGPAVLALLQARGLAVEIAHDADGTPIGFRKKPS